MGYTPHTDVGAGQLSEAIVVNANDVILVTEAQPVDALSGGPRVVYVNPAFTRMTGYASADIVGLTPRILQSPKTDRAELARLRAALEEWAPVEVELLNVKKDGSEFWVQISISPVCDDRGWFTHWIAIQRDITVRKQRENAVRALLANSSDLVLTVDARGRVRTVSPTAERILGLEPGELQGSVLTDLVHPEDRDGLGELLVSVRGLLASGRQTGDVRMRHVDGGWRCMAIAVIDPGPVADGSAGPDEFVLNCADVTEKRATEAALSLADDRFRSAFADAPIGMAVTDAFGRPVQVNAALCELLGRTEADLLGSSLDEIIHPDDVAPGQQQRQALLHGSITRHRHESRFLHSDGAVVGVLHSSSLVPGRDGRPLWLVDHIEDITERKQFEAQLSHQALHDPLTGLPNRVLLSDRLGRALRVAQRRTSSVAVMFLDLDRFKTINDSLGHQAGDAILVTVARRLESVLRPGDTVARLGGDEFVVLCEDTTTDQAARIGARILEVLSAPFTVLDEQVVLSASVGAAMSGVDADAEGLLRDADAAMYSAKDGGRARYEMFQPVLGGRASARLQLERELRNGIGAGQLRLHFQPEIRFGDQAVVGVEALIRWDHPDRGLLPPAEFITVAEETGLIHPLGEWALTEALGQLRSWRTQDQPGPRMWLNLSAHQIGDPKFADRVVDLLHRFDVPTRRLGFEITESVLMLEAESSSQTLQALSESGVSIAIDEFGTGYSSLSYLKGSPVDMVKIDRSFTAGLDKDDERRESVAIVGAVIGLAHALDLTVVGEGVETTMQAQALHGLGCDFAQGFLYGRPVPALP